METNILGLPSFTGFTPLKARQEGQVLKYDFKGAGPRVLDKSGNLNGGMLMPLWPVNSPRRSIPPRTLTFDGEDDYVSIPSRAGDELNPDEITIDLLVYTETPDQNGGIIQKGGPGHNHAYSIAVVDGEWQFRANDENGTLAQVTHPVDPGKWIRLSLTYKPKPGPSGMNAFVNGERVGYDATPSAPLLEHENNVWLGTYWDGTYYGKAKLRWVKILNKFTPKEEI